MTGAISSPMTETVIDDADSVSADGGSVSADGGAVSADAGSASADAGHLSDLKPERSARQDQNRDAAARRRDWRKHAMPTSGDLVRHPVSSSARWVRLRPVLASTQGEVAGEAAPTRFDCE